MATKAQVEKALGLISKAWGKQSGYVFFPWIDRKAQRLSGRRRQGFNEGPAFTWPRDKTQIVEHILAHNNDNLEHDIYWSALMYEYPMRREDSAMTEHALFADLDRSDPTSIDDEYMPTIAWETSPGSYQALWVAAQGDFLGSSWPGNENQRMTYYTEADLGGWHSTKLLRVPFSTNYKPDYRDGDGQYPAGKVLWSNGPRYLPGDFSSLPEVEAGKEQLNDALAVDIENVDRLAVIAQVRLKLNRTARELLSAKDTSGADKSENLWYLTRCLADEGLSISEIVAVVRETVWNKFHDRADELRRLVAEASKAIAKRSDETVAKLEEEDDVDEDIGRALPERLGFLLKNIKKPKYLVQGILTEGACGFIAGEPKSYKSWVGLDLALSVATGADFLGQFRVLNPGPVLYIQEEDPPTTMKNRSAKVWVSKSTDKFELQKGDEAGLYWLPPEQDELFDPNINAMIQKGVILSNEAWQIHLDEVLAAGMDNEPYRLMIIDTLMMTAGEVDENRSQEMTTKIFKPLKVLSRKHNVAVLVIHHMGKSEKSRPGQRMLGAVANHAWAEDSIYLARSGLKDIRIDLESKTVPATTWRMTEVHNLWWTPNITPWRNEDENDKEDTSTPRSGDNSGDRPRRRRNSSARSNAPHPALEALKTAGKAMSTSELAEVLQLNRSTVHKNMMKLLDQEKVDRELIEGSGSNVWKLL